MVSNRKPELPPKPPEAPEHLSADEKQIWVAIAPGLCTAAKAIGAENLGQVERYVVALSRWRAASAAIRSEGAIVSAKKTGVPQINPWISIERSCAAECGRLEKEFGISPTRRMGVAHARQPLGAVLTAADRAFEDYEAD